MGDGLSSSRDQRLLTEDASAPPPLPEFQRPEEASYLRVVVITIVLAGITPLVGFVSSLATTGRGWEVEGFGAFLGMALLWSLGGALIIGVGRVRSPWLGVVFAAPLIGASAGARSSPLGGLVALVVGLAAGFLGTRRREAKFLLPRFGPGIVGGVAVLAALPGLIAVPAPESIAFDYAYKDVILASYAPSKTDRRFLVPGNTFFGDGPLGQSFYLVRVVKHGRRWGPATEELRANGIEVGTAEHLGFLGPRRTSSFLMLPDACSVPMIGSIGIAELQGNCWIPAWESLVMMAPPGAVKVTVEYADGSRVARSLKAAEYFPRALIVASRRGTVPALRVSFLTRTSGLIDARPAMPVALDWYRSSARLAGTSYCKGTIYSRSCSGDIPPEERVYEGFVSMALLTPDEYRARCHTEPPAGEWVAVAQVNTTESIGMRDADTVYHPKSPGILKHIVAGVKVGSSREPATWFDSAHAVVRTGRSCFDFEAVRS